MPQPFSSNAEDLQYFQPSKMKETCSGFEEKWMQ